MTTQQSELLRGFIQSSFRASTRWTWIKSLWMQWAMSRVKYKQYEAVLWCSYLFIYHMMFFHCKHTFCKGSPSSFGPALGHVDVSPFFHEDIKIWNNPLPWHFIILLKHQEIEVEVPFLLRSRIDLFVYLQNQFCSKPGKSLVETNLLIAPPQRPHGYKSCFSSYWGIKIILI